MRQLSLLACSVFMLATAQAAPISASPVSGDSGSINNNTGYVIECSQVLGGYCANNPKIKVTHIKPNDILLTRSQHS